MLDHAEGITTLAIEPQDRIADRAKERTVYASPDFVKEDDLGIDHHRATKFKQLFLPARQVASKLIGHLAQLQELDHVIGAVTMADFLGADLARAEPGIGQFFTQLATGHGHQILADCERGKFVCNLEGAE